MDEIKRQIPENPALREEALAWLRRLSTGEATASDMSELEQWRARSPAHAHEFAEAALLWTVLGEAARKAEEGVPVQGGAPATRSTQLGRRAFLVGGGALAASVAGALVVRPPLEMWPSFSEFAADYRTQAGERQRIEMAANVSVEMNTRTSLDLRSSARIELLAGEAAITKRDDPAQEFVVLAGHGRAAATRASFNIRKDGPMVRVTCADGEVQVRCGTSESTIRDGQQIVYDERGLSGIAAADSEVVTAWQRGLLIFRRTPLAQVIDEVNRYRSGRIILLDARLGQRQVVGNFRLDRIDEVVEFMSKAMNVSTRSLPGGIVLVG